MMPRVGPTGRRRTFAGALLVRPILVVPMAASGPLGGSELLPLGLALLFAGSALFAAGVLAGVRLVLALGILSGLAGVPLALAGAIVGLPMPWPVLLAAYNMALATIGIEVWEAPRVAGPLDRP